MRTVLHFSCQCPGLRRTFFSLRPERKLFQINDLYQQKLQSKPVPESINVKTIAHLPPTMPQSATRSIRPRDSTFDVLLLRVWVLQLNSPRLCGPEFLSLRLLACISFSFDPMLFFLAQHLEFADSLFWMRERIP
jgi:hypothetical protein